MSLNCCPTRLCYPCCRFCCQQHHCLGRRRPRRRIHLPLLVAQALLRRRHRWRTCRLRSRCRRGQEWSVHSPTHPESLYSRRDVLQPELWWDRQRDPREGGGCSGRVVWKASRFVEAFSFLPLGRALTRTHVLVRVSVDVRLMYGFHPSSSHPSSDRAGVQFHVLNRSKGAAVYVSEGYRYMNLVISTPSAFNRMASDPSTPNAQTLWFTRARELRCRGRCTRKRCKRPSRRCQT